MKTCVAYPYALILSNNGAKLAFLTDVHDGGERFTAHGMARHWSKPDWSKLYKTRHGIDRADIIREWRHPPSAGTIARAAKAFNKRKRLAV